MNAEKCRGWVRNALIWLCLGTGFILSPAVYAGLFGPDTAQECIRDYATDAATERLGREIAKACRIEFSGTVQEWQRQRARCQRKKLSKVDNNKQIAVIRRECIVDNPVSSG